MSGTQASLIVVLLCAILAVFLFGPEAVLGSASTFFLWVLGGSFLLAIVWLLWLTARAVFVEVPKEIISDGPFNSEVQRGESWR
jgi:hypothetical protein